MRGRQSAFRGKDRTLRVAGILTPSGHRAFKSARSRLAKLLGWKVSRVSDGDTIEYLALGEEQATKLIQQ